MFRRGRRFFSAASIGLLFVALAHTLGNWSTTPNNDAEAAVIRAMSGYTLAMGAGMAPSFWDIFRGLTFTMSIAMVLSGVQNLLAAKYGSDQLIRALAIVNIVCVGALTVLYWVYRVPPPLFTFAVVTVLFVISLLGKSANEGGSK